MARCFGEIPQKAFSLILNRHHIGWILLVAFVTAAAALLYVAEFHPKLLPIQFTLPERFHHDMERTGRSIGGTPLGLAYGIAAAAIFVFAALLGVRRQRPTWKVGRPKAWLRAHIWLTILTVPLILLHCGFRTGSPMTQCFLALYAIVMVSGFFGLALQQFLPRLLKDQLSVETVFEQIPYVRERLHQRALQVRENLVAAPALAALSTTVRNVRADVESGIDTSTQALKQFIDETALPYLAARRGDNLPLGKKRFSDDQFRFLKLTVEQSQQENVQKLQDWCDERRELDRQTRFQHWLHGWLLVHIPFSVLLILYTAWHAIAALLFY